MLTTARNLANVILISTLLLPQFVASQETTSNKVIAERPWAAFWASSVARVMTDCDVIYESINRMELADTLEDRLNDYRAFSGIDRTRPLGMMWTWNDDGESMATVFIPVQDINELMQTATFGVVEYHKVKDDQYEIERPGAPYHVILRSGYALFGEDVAALHALRESPERLTKELREKYDLVYIIDQRQVPRDARQKWVASQRAQFEPWLQQLDDEPNESAIVRRALGKALLEGLERAVQDVQTVTIAGRIDRRTRRLQFDITIQAEPGTTMAAELNRMIVQKSEFSALVNRDASAGLAINWPIMLLGADLLAIGGKEVSNGRLDLGMQVVGSDWSDLTLIAGMRGPEASALNAAMPKLISRMEKSPEIKTINQKVATHRDVQFHQILPARIPEFLQGNAPSEIEVLIGQGKQTIWLAAGLPETLQERLKAAIDAVGDPGTDRSAAVMQARLSVGKWPAVLPIIDPNETRAELQDSKDGFTLSVLPVRNGLKIQIVAEEGLLRVIGRHWAKQVDNAAAAQ